MAVTLSVWNLITLLFLSTAVTHPVGALQDNSPLSSPLVSRIAFGSCAHQSSPQPIWDAIITFDPQLFIHLGDNIYGDNKRPFRMFGKERTIGPWKNLPRFYSSSEQEMQKKYEMAKQVPGYSQLREKAQGKSSVARTLAKGLY